MAGNEAGKRMGDGQGGAGRRAAAVLLLVPALLVPSPALAASHSAVAVSSAIALGAAALAVAAGIWALWEQHQTHRLQRNLKLLAARQRAMVHSRDALITAGREALVVWGRDGLAPRSYGGGEVLLDACLHGQEATELSAALDGLSDQGRSFSLIAHEPDGRAISVRGRAVGAAVGVWLEPVGAALAQPFNFRAILDALPIPVWLRDKTLSVVWGNQAFLQALGLEDDSEALAQQSSLDKSERDLASAARAENQVMESKRFAVIAGQRRALTFTHTPLSTGQIVGSAIDVTELSAAEARLQQHIDAHAETLDRLTTAVAIFDAEQKLSFYNQAFARLWELSEQFLDRRPSDGEILDQLREVRKLPEQRDYQSWKRSRLSLYGHGTEFLPEEQWHLPGGRTLRVIAQPHPFGGLIFLYEDMSERFALETNYNTLIKAQSATLDTLREAVAVFGTDGRLKLRNAAFAQLWELEPAELEGEPHIRRVAETCSHRFGNDAMWKRLVSSIASNADRQHDWGQMERNDKIVLSVSLAPLPDGGTLVSFADITDRFRMENALRERNEALVAADQLKSDFIHHASFLFRDPLNAVHGFADLLSSGVAGPLTTKQREYVEDILSASAKLAEVTSDILDLAMIDSGAMRLELSRVNLYELLSRVGEPLRRHAEALDIEFVLDCRHDIGAVKLDQKRIRQVVFNLLSNAFKFTPRGGRIVLGAASEDGDVQIYVSDTGPGIAPEVKANVFEHFSAKGHAGQRAGAGLGLALVNRFVELHNGWVEIDSAANRGTTVRCHLPRRVQDVGQVA